MYAIFLPSLQLSLVRHILCLRSIRHEQLSQWSEIILVHSVDIFSHTIPKQNHENFFDYHYQQMIDFVMVQLNEICLIVSGVARIFKTLGNFLLKLFIELSSYRQYTGASKNYQPLFEKCFFLSFFFDILFDLSSLRY